MCGINLIGNYSSVDTIKKMNTVIEHRGPDHQGYFSDDLVTMSLSRLAILDPTSSGQQPMMHDDLVIAYNGEVYNYQELRSDLIADGYEFSSETDTEVILKGIDRDGDAFLRQLNGIVSLAVYDKPAGEIRLFRDRLGIKPLYYSIRDGKFFASSEIKAFTDGTQSNFTQNGIAIHEYFSTKNINNESVIKEINPVPPGSIVTYSLADHTLETKQLIDVYDSIDLEAYQRNQRRSESELIDTLDDMLNRVVKRQLVSDVPLGTICSGGIDSSLITAIASQYHDDISVYHVSVADERFNERPQAEQVANHLGLSLRVHELDRSEYLSRLESCVYYNDVPLIHPNSVGVSAVNEFAHDDGIKTLLTGEGADELFGGYNRYRVLYYTSILNEVNILKKILRYTPNSEYLLQSLSSGDESFVERYLRDQPYLEHMIPSLTGESLPRYHRIHDQFEHVESTAKRRSLSFMAFDLFHHLVPLLRRADRMSMMWSVEARVPFLDNEVVNFSLNLPHKYKLRRGERKYLLKKVAERYLPDEVVYREKLGFPLPIESWLNEEGYDVDRGIRSVFYDEWYKQYFDGTAEDHKRSDA